MATLLVIHSVGCDSHLERNNLPDRQGRGVLGLTFQPAANSMRQLASVSLLPTTSYEAPMALYAEPTAPVAPYAAPMAPMNLYPTPMAPMAPLASYGAPMPPLAPYAAPMAPGAPYPAPMASSASYVAPTIPAATYGAPLTSMAYATPYAPLLTSPSMTVAAPLHYQSSGNGHSIDAMAALTPLMKNPTSS